MGANNTLLRKKKIKITSLLYLFNWEGSLAILSETLLFIISSSGGIYIAKVRIIMIQVATSVRMIVFHVTNDE